MTPPGGAANGRIPVMLMVRELDQGGVERDVAKIATHLDPSRFEPHVGSYNASGMRYDELRAAGIPLLRLPLEAPFSARGVSAGVLLWRYLKLHRIQVLHSYDVSGVLGAPVARCAGLPAILTSQLSHRDILDWKTQLALRMTDPIADLVVVNCDALRRYMIEVEGVPARRIEVCYNGVDTTQFYPAEGPRPDVLAGASLVVGTVCALRPEKGLPLLQEAFARAARPPGTKLAIVGSGVELPQLEANAARLGIAGESLFVPATPDVPQWLRAIDIFVLPSYSEGFSNSLLEAMACGCAVIGSRVGGTPELTGEEERGLLFPRGDSGELARALSLLMRNQDLRRELSARAVRFVRRSLTIEIAARRTGAIYEKLLAR
ncbi:MAG: glycosyltransferase family 4 protein [Acidobacteriia bacterium]|nr:glycosyltransferase family 4 protein [Terriglobia bacterium]